MINNKYVKIMIFFFLFIFLFESTLISDDSVKTDFEDSLGENYFEEPIRSIFDNPSKIQFHIIIEQDNTPEKLGYLAPDEKIVKSYSQSLYYKINSIAEMDGKDIIEAKISYDEVGMPNIVLKFNENGKHSLSEVTRKNIGSQMAIVVENIVLSAPRISSRVTEGIIYIFFPFGSFNQTMHTYYLIYNTSKLNFHIIEKEAYSIEELGSVLSDEMILRNPVHCKKSIFYKIKKENALNNSNIINANCLFDFNDYQVIMIEFNDKGKTEIQDLTEKNIGKKLALIADNIVYSSSNITSKITNGNLNFRSLKWFSNSYK